MIELKNISKRFENEYAVNDFTLTIDDGKTTVLIGPSGCGKSTLIRLITGLILPDEGTINFQDRPVSPNNLLEIRRNIGYVIQEGGLFPHITAKKNITIMAEQLNWGNEKINEKLEYLVELTNFDSSMLVKYPSQLSGGQRQRISLMRSLMLDPKYLLLDEPLGALDPLVRYELQNELKDIFNRLNKTVLLVTHDLAEAVFFGDEIVLMKDGKIVQKGTAKDLFENPADDFVKKFISAQRSHLEID